MKLIVVAAAALMLALVAGVAQASTFLLNFTQVGTPGNGCCGPFDVSATLQATANGNNYDITGITGTVTQNGTPFAITGLITPPSDPGNFFGFNNVIFSTAGNAPYSFDSGGIGFYAAGVYNYYSPSEPNAAFNVWGNGGSSGTLATTASYDVNTPFNGTYTISAVAEPAAWAMMLVGVGMIGGGLRMARRKSGMALTAA
jgi:hypothetical protein